MTPFGYVFLTFIATFLITIFVLRTILVRSGSIDALNRPAIQRPLYLFLGVLFAALAIHAARVGRSPELSTAIQAAVAAYFLVSPFVIEYGGPGEKPRTRFRTIHLLAIMTLFCLQLGIHQAIRGTAPKPIPRPPMAFPAFPPAQPLSPPGAAP